MLPGTLHAVLPRLMVLLMVCKDSGLLGGSWSSTADLNKRLRLGPLKGPLKGARHHQWRFYSWNALVDCHQPPHPGGVPWCVCFFRSATTCHLIADLNKGLHRGTSGGKGDAAAGPSNSSSKGGAGKGDPLPNASLAALALTERWPQQARAVEVIPEKVICRQGLPQLMYLPAEGCWQVH